jgi:hypothetical protein
MKSLGSDRLQRHHLKVGVSDDEIDRLFQLPLAEFTRARDALARQAGSDASVIRGLQKPSAAAWGVNQLFWKRRKSLDQLVASFEKVRAAQARALAGQSADRVQAEAGHSAALDAAVDDVRALLRDAGDPASASTMVAVLETLQVLPTVPITGRLSRPLAPIGFSALAGLMGALAAAPARTADVVSIDAGRVKPSRADAAREQARQQREADERRARIERAEHALDAARVAEREAHVRAERAEAESRRADDALARVRAALHEAEEVVRIRVAEATHLAAAAREAKDTCVRLERDLHQIRSTS